MQLEYHFFNISHGNSNHASWKFEPCNFTQKLIILLQLFVFCLLNVILIDPVSQVRKSREFRIVIYGCLVFLKHYTTSTILQVFLFLHCLCMSVWLDQYCLRHFLLQLLRFGKFWAWLLFYFSLPFLFISLNYQQQYLKLNS